MKEFFFVRSTFSNDAFVKFVSLSRKDSKRWPNEKPKLKRIILSIIEIRVKETKKKKVARVICPELFLLSNYAEKPIEDTRRAHIAE